MVHICTNVLNYLAHEFAKTLFANDNQAIFSKLEYKFNVYQAFL